MTIVPASIRNKNPGAQYPGKSAKKFGSSSYETLKSHDGVHKIATFPSNVQGAAAMFDLLANGKNSVGRYQYRNRPIKEAITTWCGAFYVGTYIKVLEEKGGVKRTDPLTIELLQDPDKAIPLCKAMAWQEAGRDYPMSDAEWNQAHACAFETPIAPRFAPENDVPSPKPETRLAAKVQAVSDVMKPVAALGVLASGAVATSQPAPAPSLPPAPTALVDQIGVWKAIGIKLVEFGTWASANRGTVAVILAVMAAIVIWSKRAEAAQ